MFRSRTCLGIWYAADRSPSFNDFELIPFIQGRAMEGSRLRRIRPVGEGREGRMGEKLWGNVWGYTRGLSCKSPDEGLEAGPGFPTAAQAWKTHALLASRFRPDRTRQVDKRWNLYCATASQNVCGCGRCMEIDMMVSGPDQDKNCF